MSGAEQLGFDWEGAVRAPALPGDGAPLPDQIARDRIVTDLNANLLVEAGAGSGKTTALVSRMVALVRGGTASVHQIAAVTFTRKAAGELREGFQEGLERARAEPDLRPEERARLDAALREIDRAFMGTIHAFCARLLRERPLEAGVDPAFSETTPAEARLLADRFWSLYLERLANDGAPILAELEQVGLRPLDLRGMYEDLSAYPDVEFPLEDVIPPDPEVVRCVRAELDTILDEAARLMPRREPEKEWDDLQRRLRTILYTRRFRRWSDDRVFLDALSDLCSKKSDWKMTQYKWTEDGKGRSPDAKALAGQINGLKGTGTEARELVENWWAFRYPIAMRFALDAARALEHHRREVGRLDFQDLLTLAARLLRTHAAARRELGERWRHLLVDEFQDTDPLQAEVLFLLASKPSASEEGPDQDWTRAVPRPGGLFVVGDPKQSIYRFRRADIALYMRVRERFRSFGAVLELIANFRSVEPIAELVNAVFRPPEGFPWEADSLQAAFAPLEVQPRQEAPVRTGVFYFVVDAPENRTALAEWGADALAEWIAGRLASDRTAGDFLVLTRTRQQLERYAAALEARNLPVQVSGAGLTVREEVAELRLLLEALTDPADAGRTVAVLVGLFFGLDHEQLLEHALAGRSFDFRSARVGADDPVENALVTLRRWSARARSEPADVTVARIADELGLLPHAAGGELGGVRAGTLAFVLDAVRGAGLQGDTSLTGALEAIEAALLEEEAEAPLEPGRADVIRLMNLHKAKGLEAKVVVLADPSGEREFEIDRHIERTHEGHARGWFCVTRKDERNTSRPLARPLEWDRKEAAERSFENAEVVRLLYVAATRAGEELVIARHPSKPGKSPWHFFDGWLDAHGERLELGPAAPPERESLDVAPTEMAAAVTASDSTRAASAAESYGFVSVTGLVKGPTATDPSGVEPAVTVGVEGNGEPRDGHIPPLAPLRPGSTGPGGYEWGSAVHGVLEAAARGATGDRLRAIARSLLLELDRPARGGDPTELITLLTTVECVRASDLWSRAGRASRRLSEIPFALALEGEADPPMWLEGVVDLAFREPAGWVLVDYKTDRGDDPQFDTRRLAYHEQLRRYGAAWERLTGEPVVDRLILWTRDGREERVEPSTTPGAIP